MLVSNQSHVSRDIESWQGSKPKTEVLLCHNARPNDCYKLTPNRWCCGRKENVDAPKPTSSWIVAQVPATRLLILLPAYIFMRAVEVERRRKEEEKYEEVVSAWGGVKKKGGGGGEGQQEGQERCARKDALASLS
ncbi:hypothetical protein KM043_009779 [Ampulex compressa]|nr:hypothetical protein KM043_009779 [Ampulex compressa]